MKLAFDTAASRKCSYNYEYLPVKFSEFKSEALKLVFPISV